MGGGSGGPVVSSRATRSLVPVAGAKVQGRGGLGTLIAVSPTFASLTGRIPVQAVGALTHALSYTQEEVYLKRKKGAKPRREYETRRIPLIVRHGDGYAFPSGLVPRALDALRKIGLDSEVREDRSLSPSYRFDPNSPLPDGTSLYADQIAAVSALLGRSGIAALAPNFGKTEVMAALLHAYKDAAGLILDSSRARVEQTAQRLSNRLGESVRVFGGANDYRRSRITVSTIQTLSRSLDSRAVAPLLQAPLLLVDEAHAVSPRQWFPTLGAGVVDGIWVHKKPSDLSVVRLCEWAGECQSKSVEGAPGQQVVEATLIERVRTRPFNSEIVP